MSEKPMSEKRSSVKVTIVGQELTIRSDASPEHTREVAEYVDRTIRGIMQSGAVVESSRAAILAALQITDELFRARSAQRALDESMEALSAEVRRWLPPAKRVGTGA
jgi:cell division protein ZapA